jgi:dicarboxylate/amino acid:cation (Na+ or H+) symporter, DAACS family
MHWILGVDRFLDMCRTTLNVSGDLAAAVVVARGERSGSPMDLRARSARPSEASGE